MGISVETLAIAKKYAGGGGGGSDIKIDTTLTKAGYAADAKAAGDKITETVSDINDIKSALNDNSEYLEELAENGYYTETTSQEDVYLELTSGAIANTGASYSDISKGYIWIESAQESLSLKIDTSVYAYNLCYVNESTVTKYTSWLDASPIEFDNTAHTKIGITVKRLNGSYVNNELDEIIYYTTGTTQNVGNLATKSYAVAKQQNISDSGKVLGIGSDGVVAPVAHSSVVVDNTLSIQGDAADAKKTGDVLAELAENGNYATGTETVYISTASGMISNASPPTVATETATGYVKLSSAQENEQIEFDATKYKCNLAYFKNNVKAEYSTWYVSSPLVIDSTIDHDEVYVNVRKLSGTMSQDDLSTCLYYTNENHIGDLATKGYVDKIVPKGQKCIYPDEFSSRIKPDIYLNGRYVADINADSYKVSGSGEVWVASNGNDTTGTGTEDNPFATITKALTNSSKTIYIKEGTYTQGTHYSTSVNLGGRNIIGHGSVTFQNDSSGHYVMVTGSTYIENIVFKHGNATTNQTVFASSTGSGQCVCFVGCTFRDGGDNGLSVTGIDAVLVNCIAYGNKLDGFNYHPKTSSGVTYIPNVIEIDCVSYNNGSSESGSDSCNGSTAHDGVQIIRLNGEYYSCYGGVIAEIGGSSSGDPTTKSVNFGVLAHSSTGTDTYKASFWASYNTKMYLYDCKSYGGTYDISAINDALVVSRRLTTGRDVPSVNEASTATVYQY